MPARKIGATTGGLPLQELLATNIQKIGTSSTATVIISPCASLSIPVKPMSNLSNTPGGGDLPDRYRNVGEQIQAFFDYAEKNPDRAVPFFVNIWQAQASLTTRALALQGLGVAAKHYRVKEAFADWDVLKDIAKEVKGKGEVSNDLTRWAAATALEAIGYSQQSLQHLEGGGFTEPLDRIRREIRDRKLAEINRIQRLNNRGETTAEYERNLEFWVYGPVEELFAGNDHSPNYQELVKDVIRELHGRGVYLGLISPNLFVQAEALLQAKPIFKESAEIENFLYPFLEDFLHNPNQEISFRINAAEIIHTARDLSRRLKTLSKLLLEEKNPKLQEVVLRQTQSLFKRSAEIEEYLYGLLEEFLHNPNNEASLIIGAVEIIYTSRDLSRKLKTLSPLLLEKTELRNLAVRLLTPYKQELARVNADAYTVLDALVFNYTLKTWQKPELQESKISQLETYLSSASQYQKEISSIFLNVLGNNESLKGNSRNSLVWKEYLQWMQESPIEANERTDNCLKKQIKKLVYKDLTISQLESYLSSAIQYQREISAIFTSAIDAAESLGEKYRKSASLLTGCLQNKHEDVIKATDEKSTHPLREQIKELIHIQNSIKTYQHLSKETLYRIKSIDKNLYSKTSKETLYRIKSIDKNLYSKIKNARDFDWLEYPKKIDTYNDCLQTFYELIYLISGMYYQAAQKSSDLILSGLYGFDIHTELGCLAIISLIFMLFILRDILIIVLIMIGLIVFGYTLLISHLNNKDKLIRALIDDLSVALGYTKRK